MIFTAKSTKIYQELMVLHTHSRLSYLNKNFSLPRNRIVNVFQMLMSAFLELMTARRNVSTQMEDIPVDASTQRLNSPMISRPAAV